MDVIGIKYIAPVLDNSGYAQAARGNILALYKTGIPITVQPVSFETARPDLGVEGQILDSLIGKTIDYNVVVIHTTPEFWHKHSESGKTNIGYTIWETDRLHPDWAGYINNNVSKVLVGCEWNKEVFKNSGVTIPIGVVPHVVNTDALKTVEPYQLAGVSDDLYTFYSIFQWQERKNPIALIKAYWYAFQNDEDVALVIKTYRSDYSDKEKDAIRISIKRLKQMMPMAKYPPIFLITDMLSNDEIVGLHKRGDCYFSTDRGEGFGLSPFLSAACGNPLIITGFGGSTEYAKPDNSYLINYNLTPCSGMPWCVLPGNDMVLFNERKNIEKVSLSDLVLSSHGKYNTPIKTWSRYVENESCFAIKAQGESSFTITGDHLLPIVRDNNRMEVKACDIKLHDYLVKEIDDTWSNSSELFVSDFIDVSNYILKDKFYYSINGPSTDKKVISHSLNLDESFGKLIGYYISEGSISIEKRCLSFSFGYKEDISYDCEILLKKVLGTELKISRLDRKKRSETRISIFSSLLVKLFKKLSGAYSYEKKLDIYFLQMFNENFAIGLLKGLFGGDGHAQLNGRNGFYLSLVNKDILSVTKELLCKFGVYSSLRLSKEDSEVTIKNKKVKCRKMWSLEVTGKDKIFLSELLGCTSKIWKEKKSFRKYINGKNTFFLPIQKIEEFKYTGEVFDIDMGNESPYYNIKGFLIHNCPWYKGDQLWAEPDVRHAAELLRHVYENQEEARGKGKLIQDYINHNFTYEVIGNKIVKEIEGLYK
jgi:hypothetical protein